MSAFSEANLQAQATWNNRACGLRSERDLDLLKDRSFYRTISARRYGDDDPWVPIVLDFKSMRGKHVLEIGHGMGCDLATAAMHGAITHGIDLTPNHHEIAKRLFTSEGLTGDFHLGNAGQLPFASESMDVVYSLGVLHHTDNARQCILEAHRVLKVGGRIIIALYHFWSLPHLWFIARGIQRGTLFKLGYRNMLSTVEAGADGVNIRPLVNLYTRRSIKALLDGFSDIKTSIHGLAYSRIPIVGSHITPELGMSLECRWGWYVVAHATKAH